MVRDFNKKCLFRYRRNAIKQITEVSSLLNGTSGGLDCFVRACSTDSLFSELAIERPLVHQRIREALERVNALAGASDIWALEALVEHVFPLKDPLLLQIITSDLSGKNVVLFFEDCYQDVYAFHFDANAYPNFHRERSDSISRSEAAIKISTGKAMSGEKKAALKNWLGRADLCIYNQFQRVAGKIQLTMTQELKWLGANA